MFESPSEVGSTTNVETKWGSTATACRSGRPAASRTSRCRDGHRRARPSPAGGVPRLASRCSRTGLHGGRTSPWARSSGSAYPIRGRGRPGPARTSNPGTPRRTERPASASSDLTASRCSVNPETRWTSSSKTSPARPSPKAIISQTAKWLSAQAIMERRDPKSFPRNRWLISGVIVSAAPSTAAWRRSAPSERLTTRSTRVGQEAFPAVGATIEIDYPYVEILDRADRPCRLG